MKRVAVAVSAALAVLCALAGCTDIPSDSQPQLVESIAAGAPVSPPEAPPKDALQRRIVQLFLDANGFTDGNHAAARQFLTAQASRGWHDTSVTVLASVGIGNYDPVHKSVVVSGAVVGTVNADGIYTPSLDGVGVGGTNRSFEFNLTTVDGQNRIDRLPDGLVVSLETYGSTYREYPLYFFDQAGQYLVPDPRATSLTGRALRQWLLQQLAAGPRPELVNAVDSETFPAPPTSLSRLAVSGGSPLQIEVPGASTLDDDARSQLGAQIARTLERTTAPNPIMTITDNGVAVPIKVTGGSQFTPNQFGRVDRVAPPADVYYLHNGRLVTSDGRIVKGRIASGPALQSAAVALRGSDNSLHVAASVGGQLYIGTASGGLVARSVTGLTSRPAWAPGIDEVWVGAGGRLYRSSTASLTVQPIDVASLPVGAQILAVRLSPEGARVALVIKVGSAQQLFVGAVSRVAGQVQISGLVQISPRGVGVIDAGWIEATRLYSIGYLADSSGASQIFDENVDGSDFRAPGIGNLPGGLDYVTVASGHLPWVSAQGSVWRQQSNTSWEGPGPGSSTPGAAPVYLE